MWSYEDIISFLIMQINDEDKATKDYMEAANRFRNAGYSSEASLLDAIAKDESNHYSVLISIRESIESKMQESIGPGYIGRGASGKIIPGQLPPMSVTGQRPRYGLRDSGVYVTVTYQGDTTLNIGDVICAEAFDEENERVRAFNGREAQGEYHY